ncbi:uncharacterized protein LOC119108979, partial [Pollicipes pollicipes]|uniref:uncharacterized protein LOC119108979 n=1 Tax=Pollicipes pollicipes TaxID=41117 RepID=UPI001884BADD
VPGDLPHTEDGAGPDGVPSDLPHAEDGAGPDRVPGDLPRTEDGAGPDGVPSDLPHAEDGVGPDRVPGDLPHTEDGAGPDRVPGDLPHTGDGAGPDSVPGDLPHTEDGAGPDSLLRQEPERRVASLERIRTLPYLQYVDFDAVYSKQIPVPFIPPRNSLNCDPTYELEEMIIESRPLHKKKKRLLKQRSVREGLGQQAEQTEDPLQQRLQTVAGDFFVYDREKELAQRQRDRLEEAWERELAESMQQSSPISQVDSAVIERIRADLLSEGRRLTEAERAAGSRTVQALQDMQLGRPAAAEATASASSHISTPARRRTRLQHQMTVT